MQPESRDLMSEIAKKNDTNIWFVVEKPRENTVIVFNPGLRRVAELQVNDQNNEYQEGKPIPCLPRALDEW